MFSVHFTRRSQRESLLWLLVFWCTEKIIWKTHNTSVEHYNRNPIVTFVKNKLDNKYQSLLIHVRIRDIHRQYHKIVQ
jgi:hypothetical protein